MADVRGRVDEDGGGMTLTCHRCRAAIDHADLALDEHLEAIQAFVTVHSTCRTAEVARMRRSASGWFITETLDRTSSARSPELWRALRMLEDLVGRRVVLRADETGHQWRKASKAAGIVAVTLHDLRHFYASGLIAAGCDVVTVQRALGHAKATTTLNVYAHLWPSAEDRTRAAAADLLAGALAAADCPRTVAR